MQIKGIDISRAQENFDFEAAKKAGVKFIIIRAGIRTDKDSYFDKNLAKSQINEKTVGHRGKKNQF